MADQTFAVHCGFFDAIDSDRTYSADEMNRPYRRVISNGVFATPQGNPSTDLQVVESTGMNIICRPGEGLFADKWFENPSSIVITVPDNTTTVPRIDSVLVQVDTRTSGRVGNIVYRTGTPASSPVPPAINQIDGVVEYRLANIRVNAGVTSIMGRYITDRRGSSDCPWVTSLIYQVDTSTLYDQWQAAYAEYFEEEKAIWDAWYAQLTEDLDVSMTLDRHTNTVTTTAQTTGTIPIGLAYNHNTDILEVYINGLRAIEGTHYIVVDDTSILVENRLQIGQTVTFVVMRSVISGSATNIMVLLQELESQIAGIAGGTPTVVDAKADMTEHGKIYILSTDSKWYYYSTTASDWLAGGTYGGVPTDTTLSISGSAADAKAVGDAIDGITIEVDTTLTQAGKAADAKAVGDAIAEKADIADVEEEITALDDRVTALESGGDDVPYEERGDLYDLLASAEVESMKKSNYRLYYNSTTGTVTAQSYTSNQNAIHYINPALIGYPRVWFHRVTTSEWSVYADYDPDNDSYTLITTGPAASQGKLINFSTVPEGHYIAVSSPSAYWKTGYYIYLGRVWIKPEYTPKHDGWDVPVSDEPIPCELYPVSVSYPAFYIDMEKYQDRLVRIINSGTMVGTYGIRAYTDLAGTSYVDVGTAGFFSVGDFSTWIYPGRYLVLFYRGKMTENTLNLTMGYVPVENARKCKEIGKWGAQFALHNTDTLNELIFACAVGSILDIDVCRTLDGKFVCIHSTTINGHTIAQTNLADLELTYNQMEVTDALKLMREYGVTCYFNFRETTPEQALDLTEKSYNYLGKAIVYDDTGILNANSVMAGHLNKYFVWCSSQTLDAVIALGAKTGRIFAWATKLENTSYNVGDIIRVKSIASGETLSNFEWDGECAYLWINSDIPGFVRG